MRYLVELFWSDEDEGYVAVVPDLPGCSAVGDTPEEAAREVVDAIEAWIAACRAAGDPVPEPKIKTRQAA
jgi:predicted RNase H-like HicB family nuclease